MLFSNSFLRFCSCKMRKFFCAVDDGYEDDEEDSDDEYDEDYDDD